MPSIEWQHNGNYRRCDSSDPVVVARFILEQIEIASPGHPSDYTTIKILPIYNQNKRPDWPGLRTVSHAVDGEEGLKRLAAYIMAWQTERDRPLLEAENAQPVPPPTDSGDPGSTLFS